MPDDRRHPSVLILAALILGLTAPLSSRAADPCDGLGGTGLTRAEPRAPGTEPEEGIGGTGAAPGPEDGMGGTGLGGEEDGMGGTGLVPGEPVSLLGTITGFGSICVNGERVAYDRGVGVDRDGEPAAAGDLAIGQVVAVDARADARGELRATRISVRRAIVGPVTRVDAPQGRIEVMGQSIRVRGTGVVHDAAGGTLALDRLEPGSPVAVSGLYRGDGVLEASRIQAVGRNVRASATGRAHAASARDLYVGDVRIESPADAVRSGATVRAVGRWDPSRNALVPERVESATPFAGRTGRVFVEGFARDREGSRFTISGFAVEADSGAGPLPAAEESARIVVSGTLDAQGGIRAERIRRRRGPDPGSARGDGFDGEVREERGEHGERADRADRADREDRVERSERSERADRPERPERPERPDRPERPERPERAERPERPERPDRSGRD